MSYGMLGERERGLEEVEGLELSELESSEEAFVLRTGIYLEKKTRDLGSKTRQTTKHPQRTFVTHRKISSNALNGYDNLVF